MLAGVGVLKAAWTLRGMLRLASMEGREVDRQSCRQGKTNNCCAVPGLEIMNLVRLVLEVLKLCRAVA